MVHKKEKKVNYLMGFVSAGFILFLVGVVAGIMYTTFSLGSIENSVTMIIPKHAEDAKRMLSSVLVNSQCNYRGHKKRDFIICNKDGFKRSKVSYWEYSSGLWEARKLSNPFRKKVSSYDNGLTQKKDEYITFRIHPIDEKAMFLTKYLLDPTLIGQPLGGVDVTSVIRNKH